MSDRLPSPATDDIYSDADERECENQQSQRSWPQESKLHVDSHAALPDSQRLIQVCRMFMVMNRFRSLLMLMSMVVAVGMISSASASAAAPAPSPKPAASVSLSKYESDAFAQTNKERVKHKRAVLKQDKCLKSAAQSWAKNMAKKKKMYHQSMSSLSKRCKLRGVAENVALGFPNGVSVTKAWMTSSGHRTNILNKKYRFSAVGAAKGSNGRVYVAQVFGGR